MQAQKDLVVRYTCPICKTEIYVSERNARTISRLVCDECAQTSGKHGHRGHGDGYLHADDGTLDRVVRLLEDG